jgi:hypothetical protein|eukprot:COSAG06_NODE_331_length_17352_cov_63.031098_14_plen_72_part_00
MNMCVQAFHLHSTAVLALCARRLLSAGATLGSTFHSGGPLLGVARAVRSCSARPAKLELKRLVLLHATIRL